MAFSANRAFGGSSQSLLLLIEQLRQALLRHEIQQLVNPPTVADPLANRLLKGRRDVDHGPLVLDAPGQVKSGVFFPFLAMASPLAAHASHDHEAAPQQRLVGDVLHGGRAGLAFLAGSLRRLSMRFLLI